MNIKGKVHRCFNYCFATIAVAITGTSGMAQDMRFSLNWDEKPVIQAVHNPFKTESAVVLLDGRLLEYVDDAKLGVMLHYTMHKLVKINDEKGIELFSKVYIPVAHGAELTSIKARTISAGGNVVDLPQAKFLDVEEDGGRYKKFAFEGMEKGGEVEFIYSVKKPATFFGVEYYQTSVATQRAEFLLATPSRLVFTVKGYHHFEIDRDTVVNEKRIVTATQDDIPSLENEKYSASAAHAENIQYKLSYNNSKDKNVRLFTWNELAKNVYSSYTTFTEKEEKAAQSFLTGINIPSNASETDKIVLIEDYIKNNINTDDDISSDDASVLDKVIKTKNADNSGTYRLYIALFTKLNLPFQIVYPSKRDELPLDEEFENYKLLNEMIFMFPGTGKFLEPTNKITRYPFIDPYWAATHGLFLKGTSIGTFKTAISSFDTIPIEPYEKNFINLYATIKINADFDTALLHTKQIWLGYGALPYRPAYAYLTTDKIEDFNKETVKDLLKSDEVLNIKVENPAMTDFITEKPLAIEGDIKSTQLLEKAGNKILVKLGEVIGPQVEMYQEKPRQLPVILQFPHALDRHITLVVPDGYSVNNLNDLNFNVVSKTNGEESMGFISSYTVSGNEVKVNIHEFYKQLDYPLSMFEEFKKVINASADFNKVVLVLVKK